MENRELPRPGEILEERYEVLDLIGKGGMGVVVKANDQRLDRLVAIKLMHAHLAEDDGFSRRFKREARIAKQLNHPNTVRLYDSGTTSSGFMYLVMEYLQGVELRDLIRQGPMSIARTAKLGTQIVDGLAEAHAIDVVHRDLKPANVLICRDRRDREVAKILDFGIAKSIESAQQDITQTGQLIGTGSYLAPELFLSDDATYAADVYAVGLILLEMLFGRKIFEASTIGQVMSRHLEMPVIFPRTLEKSPLAPILERAVAKSVHSRYRDAEEMFEALGELDLSGARKPIPPQEIERAFDEMHAAFDRNSGQLLDSTIPLDRRNRTMVLQDRDVEILDSTPTETAITREARPNKDSAPSKPDQDAVGDDPHRPLATLPILVEKLQSLIAKLRSRLSTRDLSFIAGAAIAIVVTSAVIALFFVGKDTESEATEAAAVGTTASLSGDSLRPPSVPEGLESAAALQATDDGEDLEAGEEPDEELDEYDENGELGEVDAEEEEDGDEREEEVTPESEPAEAEQPVEASPSPPPRQRTRRTTRTTRQTSSPPPSQPSSDEESSGSDEEVFDSIVDQVFQE